MLSTLLNARGVTLLTIGFLLFYTSACVNTKNAIYFNGLKETEFKHNTENLEPIIQNNDLLSITVTSLNPEAAKMFNTTNAPAAQTGSGSPALASGYLVDQEGFIQFPFLGKIKATGMTKKGLRDDISNQLVSRKLLLEPIVDVRYLNYKISVLGEVSRPSVLTIPNEKVTLLEAIGLAGDLTIYAKRDNILLIREEEGVKKIRRINLTSEEIFTSPYYYLKSNDIIYVEPNKSKIASTSMSRQWLPAILSSLSLAVIVLDRIIR